MITVLVLSVVVLLIVGVSVAYAALFEDEL